MTFMDNDIGIVEQRYGQINYNKKFEEQLYKNLQYKWVTKWLYLLTWTHTVKLLQFGNMC